MTRLLRQETRLYSCPHLARPLYVEKQCAGEFDAVYELQDGMIEACTEGPQVWKGRYRGGQAQGRRYGFMTTCICEHAFTFALAEAGMHDLTEFENTYHRCD